MGVCTLLCPDVKVNLLKVWICLFHLRFFVRSPPLWCVKLMIFLSQKARIWFLSSVTKTFFQDQMFVVFSYLQKNHPRQAARAPCLCIWQESHTRITRKYDSRWRTNSRPDAKIALWIPCFVSSLPSRNLESRWFSLRDSTNPETPHIIPSWAASLHYNFWTSHFFVYTAKVHSWNWIWAWRLYRNFAPSKTIQKEKDRRLPGSVLLVHPSKNLKFVGRKMYEFRRHTATYKGNIFGSSLPSNKNTR